MCSRGCRAVDPGRATSSGAAVHAGNALDFETDEKRIVIVCSRIGVIPVHGSTSDCDEIKPTSLTIKTRHRTEMTCGPVENVFGAAYVFFFSPIRIRNVTNKTIKRRLKTSTHDIM